MARKEECDECEKYRKDGHNYCRVCGFHLTKGFVPFARLALGYDTSEKFCGYCGGPKHDCSCRAGNRR